MISDLFHRLGLWALCICVAPMHFAGSSFHVMEKLSFQGGSNEIFIWEYLWFKDTSFPGLYLLSRWPFLYFKFIEMSSRIQKCFLMAPTSINIHLSVMLPLSNCHSTDFQHWVHQILKCAEKNSVDTSLCPPWSWHLGQLGKQTMKIS